jgi:hypothetical protein
MFGAFLIAFVVLTSCEGEPTTIVPKAKFLEAAVNLAQTLSQWALLIIGGTLAIIVGTSYYRPDSLKVRSIYLLFIPAWILLAFSISNGSAIQRRYLAFMFLNPAISNYQETVHTILEKVNNEAYWQYVTLEWALLCLGAWLFIYLMWWIGSKGKHDDI